jgi:hypothetical protein
LSRDGVPRQIASAFGQVQSYAWQPCLRQPHLLPLYRLPSMRSEIKDVSRLGRAPLISERMPGKRYS